MYLQKRLKPDSSKNQLNCFRSRRQNTDHLKKFNLIIDQGQHVDTVKTFSTTLRMFLIAGRNVAKKLSLTTINDVNEIIY